MFNERYLKMELPKAEEMILSMWKDQNIFEKSLERTKDFEKFIFFEGPPTANGEPGIHHILSRSMKDIFCRYKTMQNYFVRRQAGWDTHGLPVEIEIEKELNLKSKKDVEEYGIDKFNKKCKESVMRYEKSWRRLTERIGYWLDLDNPYVTFTREYIESVWWILAEFFKAGLIYKGYKVVPYCPRCGTSLSSHEVALGYEDVTEPSIYVKFKLVDEDAYIAVWTTTPWTLAANVALAVHPELSYCLCEFEGQKYYIAETRILFFKDKARTSKKVKGSELAGKRYIPLLDFKLLPDIDARRGYRVVADDFVTAEDGSGVVHIAPAFGDDDYQVMLKNDLPFINPVDASGRYDKTMPLWASLFVKDADPKIISHLRDEQKLLKIENYTHSYPFCWRCKTPLIYYAKSSWYIKTTAFKDDLIRTNNEINWHPPFMGEGRFGNWLENNVDWALSRERFWGTPLNIWICDGCEHLSSVESIDSLEKLVGKDLTDLDPHKPYIDEITFKCEKCSGTMKRTPEVIDAWFDSGSMPVAQWYYPKKNRDEFLDNFPADYISEAVDQTRGWFYTLHAIATFLFKKPAYKNVLVLGHILDKDGQKMSKSKGNVVNPWEIIEKEGTDCIRWYMFRVNQPWDPTRFDHKEITEIHHGFFNTLKNVLSFFTMYGNIDGIAPSDLHGDFLPKDPSDRWILSKLTALISDVRELLDKYDLNRSTRKIEEFVEDLSNWYVRSNRKRFWKSKKEEDKLDAYRTLHLALLNLSKLIAPFVPFWADIIYKSIEGPYDSVHLEEYPKPITKYLDKELSRNMDFVRDIVYIGHSLRNTSNLKVRQPLSTLYINRNNEPINIKGLERFIKDELNVKAIEFVNSLDGFTKISATLNFKEAKRYGKILNMIKEKIISLEQSKIMAFYQSKKIQLEVDGQNVELTSQDVTFSENAADGFVMATGENVTVILKTELTDELVREGLAREMVNKVQNLRKQRDFNVVDRIKILYSGGNEIESAVSLFRDYIKNETLAVEIKKTDNPGDSFQRINLNGRETLIDLERI